jgi:hypothetical protein
LVLLLYFYFSRLQHGKDFRYDMDQRDPKGFWPNLSRRSVATTISNAAYDLEMQTRANNKQTLLGERNYLDGSR